MKKSSLLLFVILIGLCGCGNPCNKLVSFKCDPDNLDGFMKCVSDEKEIASKCVDYMENHESKLNSMCEDKRLKNLSPCQKHNQKLYDEKADEFSKTSEFHAMVCTDGGNLIAYRATLSSDLKPILRLISQKISDSDGKSYFSVGELKKGKEVEKTNIMGDKQLAFEGVEIRTLYKHIFNISSNKQSEIMVEAYKGEKIRVVMDIPFESSERFDIKSYEFCFSILDCMHVSASWDCKVVNYDEYKSIVN